MATDPRQLGPSQLCRLLNSTPLGEVIHERQLHRHRTRAGLRIGEGRHIDLFRYVAWLVSVRHAPPAEPTGLTGYEAMKEQARARNAALSQSGRDIGDLPEVQHLDRKEAAARSFRAFCETYFPQTFHLAWSPDHLAVIARIEEAVLQGGLFALAMPRGSGKALALDTPLVTPFGWTTMGDVQVGDLLFDDEGWPCRVTFATEVQIGRPCYRVSFSDGESIVCDAEHLWTVQDRWSRRDQSTITTASMAERVVLPASRTTQEHRYRVKVIDPIRTPVAELPIDPYVLGYWLGDGARANSTITVHSDDVGEVVNEIRNCGESIDILRQKGNVTTCIIGKGHSADPEKEKKVRIALAALACHVPCRQAALWSGLSEKSVAAIRSLNRWKSIRNHENSSFQVRLAHIGVLHNKHIPMSYLRASAWQRLALLQGLMDTDGSTNRAGRCEITLKDDQLGRDLGELLSSLGFRWGSQTRFVRRNGRVFGPYIRYNFSAFSDFPVFRLARKRLRLGETPRSRGATRFRHITAIEPVESVPVRCIQVDSPSHLYLAGRKMVPTHNTTIAECACLWAILFGHRQFVTLIGASEVHAEEMLDSIKMELDGNEQLLADFPEAVYPIHCLEGIANRCAGQLYRGERTYIAWTAREIVLPTIPGSPASGAIIKVAGITGRIRGMKYKRADGRTVRPSLVILDDPQTDESARSPSQCAHREAILAGAVLGLAGPGKKISGIMPCTVIRPDDIADKILDRDRHPEWNGQRTKMVYSFPADTKLWERYAEIRAESLRAGNEGRDATEFYGLHRDAMDAGAQVAWPERFNHDELSAIQHAMNLKLQNEAAFFAEYQNEPLPEVAADEGLLTADQIMAKTNGMPRGTVPLAANHLTMFIDVQQNLLFYVVVAWEEEFSGYVLDYGAYPDQQRAYFTLRDARRTLGAVAKNAGLEGAIYAGLEALTTKALTRRWRRDDGAEMQIERCLIDANWGSSTDVVYQFCRQSVHSSLVIPSHGRFVGASSVPFSEYKRRPGDRVGLNWRIPNVQGKRAVRHVVFDANYWKSFVQARLAVAMGDNGCLSLFGTEPEHHRLLAEHLTAEYRVQTQGRGRTVDEWKLRPERSDNHWLDCLVGAAVAAAIQGAALPEVGRHAVPRKERIRLSDIKRRTG